MKESTKPNAEKKVTLTRRGKIAAVTGTAVVSAAVGGVVGGAIEHSRDELHQHPNVVFNDNNQPQPSNDNLLDAIQRHRQQMDNDIQILGKTGQLK
ncbi:MAG TPA: hypothetical protein VHB51_04025 [Candidatus Saccharimonadales bacterium]|nr:hypothetical protein [Candidatus Saccharimonadales bacterium]